MTDISSLNLSVETFDRAPYITPTHPPRADEQLATFFARPVRVLSIPVTTTATPVAYVSLFKLWAAQTAIATKLNTYYAFRGVPHVRVVYSGNPTSSGTIGLFFQAFQPGTDAATTYGFNKAVSGSLDNLPTHLQLPHVLVNTEEASTTEIQLLWMRNKCLMHMDDEDWFPIVTTINPVVLNSQATPASQKIDVYVSYHDVSLYIPIEPHGGRVEDDGWLSSRLNYVSTILNAGSSALPFLSPWAAVTGALGKFAGAMGFSRPISVPMTILALAPTPNIAFVSGAPDFSSKLALDPAVSLDISGCRFPNTSPRDTNLDEITTKWGLVAADVPLVNNFPPVFLVTPTVCLISGSGIIATTPLAFAASFFQYWRGDMEMKFEFVANPLLRCRYAIQVIPPGLVIPANYDGFSSYQNTIVEVVGRTEAVITIPYNYRVPYSPVVDFNYPLQMGGGGPHVVIYILDNVQGFTGTSPGLRVNAWIRAAKDFNLAKPRLTFVNKYTTDIVAHGGNADGETNVATFGENVTDLLQLTRRPVRAYVMTAGSYVSLSLPVVPPVPSDTPALGLTTASSSAISLRTMSWTYSSLLSTAYWCTSGGSRIKLRDLDRSAAYHAFADHNRLGAINMMVTYPPPAPYSWPGTLTSTGIAYFCGSSAGNQMFEVEIPSAIRQAFTPGPLAGINNLVDVTVDSVNFSREAAVSGPIEVYYAGADDFIVRSPYCTPQFRLIVSV